MHGGIERDLCGFGNVGDFDPPGVKAACSRRAASPPPTGRRFGKCLVLCVVR